MTGNALIPADRPVSPDGGGADEALALPLGPAFIEALAEHLAPKVAALLQEAKEPDRWLDSGEAADYLGMTTDALHKHTQAMTIPFEQERPNCKLWFKRSELDRWRSGGGSR